MDLEDFMLSETSQTEKDKYYIISLISGMQKKPQNQKPELIDGENTLMVARVGVGWWRVGKMGKVSQKYKLPVINKLMRKVMYSIVTIVNNTLLHI